ncbi:MAG TPA: diaminopimelate epimerase [Methanoculleus sp.]|nr:diaminopimelate epimerase [Methanoculleus sp.]
MEIYFTKLHGNGNDFILINELQGTVIPDDMKPVFARLYCDRRYGIGADGVLFLSGSATSLFKMRLFQPDESEAEMCGNGIRCLGRYIYDANLAKDFCTVETPAGEITMEMKGTGEGGFSAVVSMPTPRFDRADIPAEGEGEYKESIADYEVYAVSVGVPHAVVFVDEIAHIPLDEVAPIIRRHHSFPEGANVNFVEIAGENELRIRTFERGIEGETLSCGTGATASAAVAHHLAEQGMAAMAPIGTTVEVHTPGGPLTIYLDEETKMEGPAVSVFTGVITF